MAQGLGFDPAALRQALMAKQMAVAPQAAEGIDPALLAELQGGGAGLPPPADMPQNAPVDPGLMGAPAGAGIQDPAVQMEMERAKVKDMLKRVRMKEAQSEANQLMQARMGDIQNESNEIFSDN